jgi:5,5'-dehydrodivanillate O-demethylase
MGWRSALAWRVPADDNNHYLFLVYRCEVAPANVAVFRERMMGVFKEISRLKPNIEVARDVLEGRMRMIDVPEQRDDIIIVQDEIAQLGQGVIVDRTTEHLSPINDAPILLLRQIWRRELTALRDGKPLKQWAPTIPTPTVGL